jgi:S1-C subfamily serine protease
VAVLCAALLFVLGSSVLLRADEKKEKPKDAPTLDDRTAMLTETVDGKEKKTKVELKYSLKVKGFFDKDGYHIEELDDGGPAAMLHDGQGNTIAMMEKGDIIVEVDGKKIKSADDYVKAMNGVADSTKIKLKVKDVNTGQDADFHANAAKL